MNCDPTSAVREGTQRSGPHPALSHRGHHCRTCHCSRDTEASELWPRRRRRKRRDDPHHHTPRLSRAEQSRGGALGLIKGQQLQGKRSRNTEKECREEEKARGRGQLPGEGSGRGGEKGKRRQRQSWVQRERPRRRQARKWHCSFGWGPSCHPT